MKLYYHPVSTVSRPVMMFAADNGIVLDYQLVDLMKGEQRQPPYITLNPSGAVPMLEDGDFRLAESSAILKYLADKIDSPAYPKDLQKRARVNEMMDWLNTGFYRDFGYGLIYPQIFPNMRRRSDEAQAATLEAAKQGSRFWLGVLNERLAERKYLCGSELTIADYFGAGILSLSDVICCDLKDFPNVARWLATMKAMPNWDKANEVYYGMVGGYKGQTFETV